MPFFQRNAEGFTGHVTKVFYRIDRAHKVSADGIILYNVGIRPLGYADFVKGQLGFFIELPAAA